MRGRPVSSGRATVYISTGGGGAVGHAVPHVRRRPNVERSEARHHYLRVQADSATLTISAVDKDGREFDTTVLARPRLAQAGGRVVNGAEFTASVAPGGIVTIFGEGLANGTAQFSTVPLPTSLKGTTVTVNGEPLPLYYVSPNQINAQLRTGPAGACHTARHHAEWHRGTAPRHRGNRSGHFFRRRYPPGWNGRQQRQSRTGRRDPRDLRDRPWLGGPCAWNPERSHRPLRYAAPWRR